MNSFRSIPSVDYLLNLPVMVALQEQYGHEWCLKAVRKVLEEIRSDIKTTEVPLTDDNIVFQVESLLKFQSSTSLQAVINATGVVLHTNLGRAPL